MEKIDYKKELKNFYSSPKGKFVLVDVPKMNYLMIDGKGNPNTSIEFKNAVEALYSLSYTLKFKSKARGQDYTVMPLEGLWYAADMANFANNNKDEWQWTVMIMQPEVITIEMVNEGIEEVRKKKNPVSLGQVRFENFREGLSVQVMYIGPYAEESETISQMHQYINEQGYTFNGKHHEIYLSDPNRVAPEKLKTILRQPIKHV
jgi:hypothetical protein